MGEKSNKKVLRLFSSGFKKSQLGRFERNFLAVVEMSKCKLPGRSKAEISSSREATVSETFYVYL